MEFKVPQNVQREDTIIGSITFKQLGILLIGGGITYVIYLSLANVVEWFIWAPPVGIIGLATLVIAFVKVQDMTFTKAFLYFLEFIINPRKRFYSTNNLLYHHSYSLKPLDLHKTSDKQEIKKVDKRHKIDELSNLLDS